MSLGGSFDSIMEGVRARLAAKHAARERALALCRESIRLAANAIRAVHREEFTTAARLIEEGRGKLAEVDQALAEYSDIYHAGFVHDAQKEFVEASLTLALVQERDVPAPRQLGVSDAAYLNGLGEAVGELRRRVLDLLRRGEVPRCERYLRAMDDIYGILVSIDYPDAMTGGLRRTTDVARGILEKTRGDLTLAAQQSALERRIAAFERRLPNP